ncbi:aminotransferase class III-fold pyridoxal phosphate-dependent enzyme [Salinibacterium sp. UTAS2018]|uniref:aminotransferase n=1 Tax=unclassified Salinibacterium TaxID=2632331 RepID=UPI0010095331|nr:MULTISPECIES: aminotransferase [unclassified Salinibacterium]MBH0007856.1 aminotransferase class III-fold pyridoxal phosphate-dependent enzyme [Salinibacterium sp. SWN1162]QAV70798.1 aminotransferase class III-fold pyridoxal phosphate-dependent enzyme [Salinibacterium sp. UTAS2018]
MSHQSTASLQEMDRHNLFHPFTALKSFDATGPALTIVSGSGSTLTDSTGGTYLDAMAGLWCVNIGYSRPEMAEALAKQANTLPYYHAFSGMGTDLPARLAKRLTDMAPVPVSRVFFGNSGSDANDTQAKLVWYYNNVRGLPNKKKIISRTRGYHGVTVLSAGLTGLTNLHDGFDLPLPMIRHVRPPHRLWEAEPGMTDADFVAVLARELEELILAEGPDTVAAFIAEPMQAAGGVIIPPAGYFEAIQAVLNKYDVLLIADEVVCGFGRLGVDFGTTAFGMKPDLITVAKGITSAYVPLSACLVTPKVWDVVMAGQDLYGGFGHGYTYSAHPLAAAAALTNLDIIENENLTERAATVGAHMHRRLQEEFAGHPNVGEIRGQGLVGAVEFVQSTAPMKAFDPGMAFAAKVTKRSLAHGVITRALPAADTISFSPPFTTTEEEIDAMVAGTRRALDDVVKEEGLIG